MSISTLTAFSDATVFTGEAFVESCSVIVQNGKVLDIVTGDKTPDKAEKRSFAGRIFAPGFIDCQVNGGGGVMFNETPSLDAITAMAKAHRKYGTTRILPTCISDSLQVMRTCLSASREARKMDPSILGIHFEGPHISKEKRGCHVAGNIRPVSSEEMGLYAPVPDEIMLITVAPEHVSAEDIKLMKLRGAIVSLGHSMASSEQSSAGLAAGATGFTHLFNAMAGLSARSPGIAGCALDSQNSWCGIIIDGHHASDEMVRLAYRSKPKGKLFLVSDAMPPSGCDIKQPFALNGEEIKVKDGRCINRDGQLSGSSITISDAVRYCINKIGIEPMEALRMASTYPAAFLGLDKKLGRLLPGYEADIVVLDAEYKPEAAFVGGVLD